MKYSEIQNLEIQELRKRLHQNKNALFEARMKHKMQRLSNMMTIQNLRHDMARLQTALTALEDKKEKDLPARSKQKKESSVKAVKAESTAPKNKQVYPKKRIKKGEVNKAKLVKAKALKKTEKKDLKKVPPVSVDQVSEKKKKTGWFSFMNRLKKNRSTEPSDKVKKSER